MGESVTIPGVSRPTSHIVLLGLMGVGKTTVGRGVAARLGWPMSDSDEAITARCGATVRELSERLGVPEMHELEADHLLGVLAEPGPVVVCAAASVVDDDRCLRALGSASVLPVWLRGGARILSDRFSAGPHRPVLDTDTEALFRRQISERSRRFQAVARLVLDVEDRPAAEIAAEIAARAMAAAG
jgi:shikimate kinase